MSIALTSTELLVLNNSSRLLDKDVKLGTKLSEIIGFLPKTGTPVNAVAAKMALDVSGVVAHGETVTINNPAKAGVDVYEFLADVAQTKSTATNIAVDITAHTTKSTGTLTMDTQPTAGDTITIGGKTYIFVPVGTDTADGEVSIGADLAGAQTALVAAINGTDDVNEPHPLVRAGNFSVANVSTITALVGGTVGDAINTTETFTAASNVFAAAHLGSGADCTAANAITALVAAVTASDTQGVGAADGTGDVVDLTADVAGVAGNAIEIAEDMAHGTFTAGATTLAGGVNGTVSDGVTLLVDASYIYICLAANTISGANWLRVSATTF